MEQLKMRNCRMVFISWQKQDLHPGNQVQFGLFYVIVCRARQLLSNFLQERWQQEKLVTLV
jgi:hypothetical protein